MSVSSWLPDEREETGTIGQRIRAARKALGLNQEALAARIGVTQPTIANWEAEVHNPRQAMLRKLAGGLGVSLGWLAGGESDHGAERGPDPAVSYLRRPLVHVPVVPASNLEARRRFVPAEAGQLAIDFVPLALAGGPFFAVAGLDLDAPATGASATLAVFDGGVVTFDAGLPCLVCTGAGLRLISNPLDMPAPPWGTLVQIIHQF